MHEYFLGLPRKIVIIRASVAKKISAIKKTFVTKEKKISAIKKNIRAFVAKEKKISAIKKTFVTKEKKISAIKKNIRAFVAKEKKISAIKKNIRASRRDAGQVSWQKKRKLVS